MKIFKFIPLSAALLLAATSAWSATLKIGDPAPALQVGQWVQGEPVQGFDSQHVYIVEFWATWCGPCKASIPHLNEIWEKYKDKNLVVIGQDCWENNEAKVPNFVTNTMAGKMTYRVALDNKSQETNGAMAVTWMKAAGQNGIPSAFIINHQGKIAWIGHPMSLTESVLDDILADKFDVAAYAAEANQRQQEQEAQQALAVSLTKAIREQDWDAADKVLDGLEKNLTPAQRAQASPTRLTVLLGRKDFAGAGKLAESVSDLLPSNAEVQNELAWSLAIAPGVDAQGLAIAKKVAARADTAAGSKNPDVLDTLARLQFMTGETNEAVATEQKAVAAAPDEAKGSLQQTLADYQAGKLPDVKH
jgi:thiol-disulfide isomerase/thioredoxin